jgi:serine/threonine protein kinase
MVRAHRHDALLLVLFDGSVMSLSAATGDIRWVAQGPSRKPLLHHHKAPAGGDMASPWVPSYRCSASIPLLQNDGRQDLVPDFYMRAAPEYDEAGAERKRLVAAADASQPLTAPDGQPIELPAKRRQKATFKLLRLANGAAANTNSDCDDLDDFEDLGVSGGLSNGSARVPCRDDNGVECEGDDDDDDHACDADGASTLLLVTRYDTVWQLPSAVDTPPQLLTRSDVVLSLAGAAAPTPLASSVFFHEATPATAQSVSGQSFSSVSPIAMMLDVAVFIDGHVVVRGGAGELLWEGEYDVEIARAYMATRECGPPPHHHGGGGVGTSASSSSLTNPSSVTPGGAAPGEALLTPLAVNVPRRRRRYDACPRLAVDECAAAYFHRGNSVTSGDLLPPFVFVSANLPQPSFTSPTTMGSDSFATPVSELVFSRRTGGSDADGSEEDEEDDDEDDDDNLPLTAVVAVPGMACDASTGSSALSERQLMLVPVDRTLTFHSSPGLPPPAMRPTTLALQPAHPVSPTMPGSALTLTPTSIASSYLAQNFEVRDFLGYGADGKVFLTHHGLTDMTYATKIIHLRSAQHEAEVLKEVRLHAPLLHDNVVRFFNCWVERLTKELYVQLIAQAMRRKRSGDDLGDEDDDLADGGDDMTECSSEASSSAHASLNHSRRAAARGELITVNGPGLGFPRSPVHPGGIPLPPRGSPNAHGAAPAPQLINVMLVQMEYCPLTLQRYITRRTHKHAGFAFDRGDNLRIMLGICTGLAYLHKQAMIHRDIKPANIFVDKATLQTKLGDFGLSKHHDAAAAEGTTTPADVANAHADPNAAPRGKAGALGASSGASSRHELSVDIDNTFSRNESFQLTQDDDDAGGGGSSARSSDVTYLKPTAHTHGLGSPLYSAPEQLAGLRCDAACDVFAAGVVFVELYLEPLTAHEREKALKEARRGAINAALLEQNPELGLAAKMLCAQPEDRVGVRDIRRVLKSIIQSLDETEFA